MKTMRLRIVFVLCTLLLTGAGSAEEKLKAEIRGSELYIQWNTMSDTCVLTVYRNDWPFVVCNVGASGTREIPADDSGEYRVRLKTDSGCLTASAELHTPEATRIPQITPAVTRTPAATIRPAMTPRPTVSVTSAPAATVRPESGTNQNGLAAGVIDQVNMERAKQGLKALKQDEELTRAACVRAMEIVKEFSHTRPDGSSWSTVSEKAYGENIAKGQKTVDRVMASWMSSDGHRKNILKESYGSIGVCAYIYNGITYWVQLFGK